MDNLNSYTVFLHSERSSTITHYYVRSCTTEDAGRKAKEWYSNDMREVIDNVYVDLICEGIVEVIENYT